MQINKITMLFLLLGLALIMAALVINLPSPSISPGMVIAEINQTFILSYNQTALIVSEDLYITFSRVMEDSRCPSDVICEWPGQVTIQLKIKKGSTEYNQTELTLSPYPNSNWKNVAGYNISLGAVQPYPNSSQNIAKEDYKVALLIRK